MFANAQTSIRAVNTLGPTNDINSFAKNYEVADLTTLSVESHRVLQSISDTPMIQVQVYRYNPQVDTEPRMERYEVEDSFRRRMVLDVLEHLKAREPGIAYRRSCREGVCGSDGMNINGQNALACVAPVSEVLAGIWVAQKSNYGSGSPLVGKKPLTCIRRRLLQEGT